MAVMIDAECNGCGKQYTDVWSTLVGSDCDSCLGGKLEHLYTFRTRGLDPGTHTSERVVVYQSALENGKIQYPGRTDVPIPERLRQRGYERIELNVRDLAKFERKHNVANERRHFNNGNGF